MRINNLSKVDVNLQIKLSKLHNQLSQKEQLELAEIMRLLIQSLQERESNDALCTFTNIPSINKEIERTCLRSKHFMLQNMSKPKTTHDGNLCVMNAVEDAKNSSLLGFNIALIRDKHYDEDIERCVNNSVANGKKM